jgi:hypothetical protein
MKIIELENFKSQKGIKISHHPTKRAGTPSTQLRKTDWQALLQHDRVTGKLDLKSKAVLRDPGSVKRLLEGKMIDPYGKLTAAGKKKYAAIIGKLQNLQSNSAASVALARPGKNCKSSENKDDQLTASDWAVLMKYDRKTGNLLTYDPKTERLDNGSLAILKNPSIIQRLMDNGMVLTGGWLTPQAKRACARIKKDSGKQTANGHVARRPRLKAEPKKLSELQMAGCSGGESGHISAPAEKIDPLHSHWPKDEDLQKFFMNL